MPTTLPTWPAMTSDDMPLLTRDRPRWVVEDVASGRVWDFYCAANAEMFADMLERQGRAVAVAFLGW